MAHITKRFGALEALADVSLAVQKGQVHGLLGENGAGKSTLMNILFGLLRPDAGEIRVAGRAARIGSPRAAQRLGIGMVHQHFKLVPTLTVAENLSLLLRCRLSAAAARGSAWLGRLHWTVPMHRRVENLSVGQQQRVEILKALLGTEGAGARTLIFDEPTAVLTPQETGELFTAIRTLRDAGTVVIFISHKLAEVRQICDAVTILRRGRVVHTGKQADISPEAMAAKMVGATVELPRLQRTGPPPAAPVLHVSGMSAGRVRDASFEVRSGEIVGIAGVDGNGQADLVGALVGLHWPAAGAIRIAGGNATRLSLRERTARIAFIPEDRQAEALVLPLSVEDNLLLKNYRLPPFAGGPPLHMLHFAAWRRYARDLVRRFDVRCRSITQPVGTLSGGNQQKVVVARELSENKPLVIAVNPTRGLDVGATAFVMSQLLAARQRGAAVLLIHSDLDELLAISDRVLVIYNGRLTDSRWPDTTREHIGRMMLGLAGGAAA